MEAILLEFLAIFLITMYVLLKLAKMPEAKSSLLPGRGHRFFQGKRGDLSGGTAPTTPSTASSLAQGASSLLS